MNIMEVGDRYGKLVITKLLDEKNKDGRRLVECKYDCGTDGYICSVKRLTDKKKPTRSCGCLRLERVHEKKTAHGDAGGAIIGKRTRLYRTWSNIKSRCYNENVRSYANYGAKGITMCDEWLNSYETFRDWALSHGYSEELTIDRINPNGNYEPDNCRWITLHDNSVRAHEVSCWGKNLTTGEYVEFVNIRNFASERGLSYSCIDRVLHGKNKTHKNWVFGYK